MYKALNILVVEDEALTALELQKKLVLWGYKVVGTASSGEKAVEMVFELKPDLIIMDILLKGEMTGIDAAVTIRNQLDIPIIYLTAYCNVETFEGAKVTQPYAYLIKPFQEYELKFAIEMALYGHKSQLELKKSEVCYRKIAESVPDMIFVIDKDLSVNYANESSFKCLQLPKKDVIGKHVQDIFSENDFEVQKTVLNDIFRTGNPVRTENFLIFPDCELWLDTMLEPLKNDKGEVCAIIGISRNITPDKNILEQKDLLIRGIHFNLGKNLKMVSSLFCIDSASIPDEDIRSIFRDSETCLLAMALIHEKMYHADDLMSIDFGDYLKSLVELLIDFYKSRNIVDCQVNTEKLFLSTDITMSLGIIANALISNSLKYSFQEGVGGKIKVQIYEETSYLILKVSDNGGGVPVNFDFRNSENLGFKIIKNVLAEIDGEMEHKIQNGVHFIIKIPKYHITPTESITIN